MLPKRRKVRKEKKEKILHFTRGQSVTGERGKRGAVRKLLCTRPSGREGKEKKRVRGKERGRKRATIIGDRPRSIREREEKEKNDIFRSRGLRGEGGGGVRGITKREGGKEASSVSCLGEEERGGIQRRRQPQNLFPARRGREAPLRKGGDPPLVMRGEREKGKNTFTYFLL